MKILVVGIGGVGGFFGGLLAKEYINNETVKIYFLARGKHLEAIKQDGLKIIHRDTFFIAHPHMASYSSQ